MPPYSCCPFPSTSWFGFYCAQICFLANWLFNDTHFELLFQGPSWLNFQSVGFDRCISTQNINSHGWISQRDQSMVGHLVHSTMWNKNQMNMFRFYWLHPAQEGCLGVCALRWMVCWVEGNFASLKPVVVVDVYKYFIHVPRVGVRVYNNRTPKNNLSPSVPKSHHQDSVYPTRTKIPTTPTWGTV